MKRSRRFPVTLAMAALLLAGCGASGNSAAEYAVPAVHEQYSAASPSYAAEVTGVGGASSEEGYSEANSVSYDTKAAADMGTAPEEGSVAADSDLLQGRKLIKTVELEMETKEFERMLSELETQIRNLGGYIENLETYNGSSYSSYRTSRWANLAIRIPRESLEGFLQNMSEIGNVVRRSDSVEDVTLSYVDMESRRDTLKAEQARLLELMGQADTVEDMIALEERLSNVRYYLESMESKLRIIDNQVDYSTVNLNLTEVKELTSVEERTDLQRITEGFTDSLKEIGHGIKEGVIWILAHLPYLVVWTVVITVLVLVLKKYRKKRIARKAANKPEAEQAAPVD